jgi:hypothetical protein
MSGFPIFTVEQLAEYSGRDIDDYTTYANQALLQAVVLFMMVTQQEDWPTDPLEQNIAQLGILAYADVLVLQQPYQDATHSPFQSQNAGSVSWSKPVSYIRGNAASNALKGEQTGITWFDLAVQKLAKRTEFGGVYSQATEMTWEDEVFVREDHITGEVKIVGPAEMDKDTLLGWGDWSSDSWPADVNGAGFGGMKS